jgi:hypothetical protein
MTHDIDLGNKCFMIMNSAKLYECQQQIYPAFEKHY